MMITRILLVCMLTLFTVSLKTTTLVKAEEFGSRHIEKQLDSSVHKVIDSVNNIKAKSVVFKSRMQNKVALLQNQQKELQILQSRLDSINDKVADK